MSSHRLDRVRNLLRQATSEIVGRIKDPRVGFVTVTDAEVSPDLRHARVYVSILGSEDERKQALKGLESARGFVRRELHKEITLRHIPEVSFFLDESLDRGMRVNELLATALREDEAHHATQD
ncbi:MAG: 30S ribosome-binding factor RbfA [Armatimonadetes bacterium]|nr:30S ribosome-binding factor RbfA [Armatimonadota bacterium]